MGSSTLEGSDVGGEVTSGKYVPLRTVLAHPELSLVAVEDGEVAILYGAAHGRGGLPDDLGEVTGLRVGRIVLASFVGRPIRNSLSHAGLTCRDVLPERSQSTSRMLENAFVSPLLSFGSQLVAPLHGGGAVLGSEIVLGFERFGFEGGSAGG